MKDETVLIAVAECHDKVGYFLHDSLSRGVHDISAILVIGFDEIIFGREL